MTTWKKFGSASLAAAVCGAGFSSGAHGGGLFVPGFGSQGQPRAGAFVAKADDPSALYYNPAGFAKQKGTTLYLGLNLIDFEQRIVREGGYEAPLTGPDESYTGDSFGAVEQDASPTIGIGGFQGIPTIAVATDLGGRTPLVFGVGLIAEHGFPAREYRPYGTSYAFEDPEVAPPPNRYDIVEQDASVAFPSVAAAYSLGTLDVGARVSWGIIGLKGTSYLWGVRNFEESIHKDSRFTIDVTDHFVPAAQLGLLYRPTTALELGAQYTTPRQINGTGEGTAELGSGNKLGDIEGMLRPMTGADARCADGGTVAYFKSCVNFTLPQTATLGARYVVRDAAGRERGDLEFDVQWEDWSSATDYEVIVDAAVDPLGPLETAYIRHGFRDTFSFRVGGGWDIPLGRNVLTARGGVAYDTATAPVSWTRGDIDGLQRLTVGLGGGLQVGKLRFDLGGGYVHEPTRVVDSGCNPDAAAPGCDGTGAETPTGERDAPDPVQPILGAQEQVQSPFNDGTYRQHYVLVSMGVTYAF